MLSLHLPFELVNITSAPRRLPAVPYSPLEGRTFLPKRGGRPRSPQTELRMPESKSANRADAQAASRKAFRFARQAPTFRVRLACLPSGNPQEWGTA
jgi:hypothetical protein